MQFDDRGILLRYEYCYSPHRHFLFYCVCDFTPACDFDLEILEEEKALSKSKISGVELFIMQMKTSPAHVTISTASSDVGAGYQIFGKWAWWMTDKSYLGRVWSRTESVQYLKNNAKEWHVMHQYETDAWGNIKAENAILLMRDDGSNLCLSSVHQGASN